MEILEKRMNETFSAFSDGMMKQFGMNPAQLLRNSSLSDGIIPDDICEQIHGYCDDVRH